MFRSLDLRSVGPAARLNITFAPRLNLFTGDNGLGKSFLLDVAWWCLTRTWARGLAVPRSTTGPGRPPGARISAWFDSKAGSHSFESKFDRAGQFWPRPRGRPPSPGLVMYAQVDGGIAVWDPARNYWRSRGEASVDRPAAFAFAPSEIWDGLPPDAAGRRPCRGLIEDWAAWQREDGLAFRQLSAALATLSPSLDEPLKAGALTHVYVDDTRDIPTISTAIGDVPVIHASAGMRRIIALAYLLVWNWREHIRAAEMLGIARAREFIVLIDEVEAHLHPSWQRGVMSSLLAVVGTLAPETNIQLLVVTHSPLVLASVEPHFDVGRDQLSHFALRDGGVTLETIPWAKQGDVINWLVSDAFGLRQGRSREAERAIEAAEAFMRGDRDRPHDLTSKAQIHAELTRTLSDIDRFWPRWIVHDEPPTARSKKQRRT